jgi:hypothetical protein
MGKREKMNGCAGVKKWDLLAGRKEGGDGRNSMKKSCAPWLTGATSYH